MIPNVKYFHISCEHVKVNKLFSMVEGKLEPTKPNVTHFHISCEHVEGNKLFSMVEGTLEFY